MVTNLLSLSTRAAGPAELLPAALEAVARSLPADAAAIVTGQPPQWIVPAVYGTAASQVPTELAADALARESIARRERWAAAPLNKTQTLVVRSAASDNLLTEATRALSDALAVVDDRQRSRQRVERLKTILAIVREWQQTEDMNTLLVRMAEASCRMFDADRASIFLWDKATKTVVGRPALGVAGGELRLPDDAGVVGQVVQTGEPRRVSGIEDSAEIDRRTDTKTGYRTKTILCVPLVAPDGTRLGAFELLNKKNGSFTAEDERGLIELAGHAAVELENTREFEDLLARQELMVEQASKDTLLVGESPAIQAVRSTIRRVADTDLAILILGENGTGKEVVARSLHYASRRRTEPFIPVNCASLTETLLESELFGHEKGAFTDAHEARAGKFEAASGGTLFLDEIGDMSLSGQAKLLRVLEEKKVVRVGGNREIHTDVRVLAATNQKLAELVRARRFREDLYFRLNVVSLELPPLRDRGDDILILAEHFLRHFSKQAGRRTPKLSASARKRLISHTWPGNVRELRNLMERLAYLSAGEKIEAEDLAFILSPTNAGAAAIGEGLTLNDATDQFQTEYIKQSIARARGNVSLAAKNLGVHRSNLYRKMRQLGMATDDSEGVR
ncbi:MAG: sigma 54-interacting transcriptional regulator [Pirellulales bacterium]